LTTSNRADNSFGANNDSLALFSLSSSGDFTFQNIYPTYASYPRTMVINKAGDKVAIGNQNSASVTVVERNVTSGVFGRLLGSVVVGSTGSNGNGGLSSVIWEE
jgi:6-phosphogluconolactonase (cycloisomerase 2 family)